MSDLSIHFHHFLLWHLLTESQNKKTDYHLQPFLESFVKFHDFSSVSRHPDPSCRYRIYLSAIPFQAQGRLAALALFLSLMDLDHE
jgi:hypothetical protein